MRSVPRGRSTSAVEVAQISEHGLWVLVEGREHFMPFEQFPWFRQASVAAVLSVELAGPGHLYWPDLDVDLAVESIEHPDRFPLVSKTRPNNVLQPPAGTRRSARTRAPHRARRG
jgi:hypothetical protein